MEPTANPLAERYGINGHRVVLYAGTFESYQGLDLLIEAAQEVVGARKNLRFLCVGGTPGQVDKMKSLARRLGVAEYFIFPGTVPPEEFEGLLGIASILVWLRITGTNTPLKTYLRAGRPIIATKMVSHTQVLTDDVALLVEPRPNVLGNGLRRLLDDAQLCNRLATNALRLAEHSYSPDGYRRKVAEVLLFLASRARKPV